MTHRIDLGAFNHLKETKKAACLADRITDTTSTGAVELEVIVPDVKLWVIQQLGAFHQQSVSRDAEFYIKDEIGQRVAVLSTESLSRSSVPPGRFKTFVGNASSYVPSGWFIGVRWFGIDGSGFTRFLYHVTELDLD
jgi:hypothetical protein